MPPLWHASEVVYDGTRKRLRAWGAQKGSPIDWWRAPRSACD
jgi:hypothetical protein